MHGVFLVLSGRSEEGLTVNGPEGHLKYHYLLIDIQRPCSFARMATAETYQEAARLQQEKAALWQKLKDARAAEARERLRNSSWQRFRSTCKPSIMRRRLMRAHLIPDPRFISTDD